MWNANPTGTSGFRSTNDADCRRFLPERVTLMPKLATPTAMLLLASLAHAQTPPSEEPY